MRQDDANALGQAIFNTTGLHTIRKSLFEEVSKELDYIYDDDGEHIIAGTCDVTQISSTARRFISSLQSM